MPRLLHHRVARVVVRQSEDQVLFARQGGEFLRLGEIERGGLVRHDVETGLQGGPSDWMVGVVGRCDDDEVHAVVVGTTGFGRHHLIVGAVAALRVDAVKRDTGPAALRRVAGERAASEGYATVEFGRHAVDRADEGALAAPDQTHL